MECLKYGWSIDQVGSPGWEWPDLIAVVEATSPESALYGVLHPDSAEWTLTNHLLAVCADALRLLVWAKGKAKLADRPRPIPRPGVEDKKTRTIGSQSMDIDTLQVLLDKRRRGA